MGRVDGSQGLGFGKETLSKEDREVGAEANSPTTQWVLVLLSTLRV